MTSVKAKLERLLKALAQGTYEREEPIKLALLSAIAGESIFLLGPPGVGKSLIARRLKYAFKDGRAFEYLMSRFSTPDEIFGPISIKKLKEEDKYERLTERYLPGASIVFLDEIWKAGPAIQNALLTILNEKIYRNGEEDLAVDIRGIITASNELPPKTESHLPLWDRFLIRYEMKNIRKMQNFLRMITSTEDPYADTIPEEDKLGTEELEAWDTAIDQISLQPEVLNTLQVVKLRIEEYNEKGGIGGSLLQIHDRRWKKIVRLLRTSAFLNGRESVDLMDTFLIIHCLWSEPAQIAPLKELTGEVIRNHGYSIVTNLNGLKKELEDFEAEVNREIKLKVTQTEKQLRPIEGKYFELEKNGRQFEGDYIKMQDFRNLALEATTTTNLYDKQLNMVRRLQMKKGKAQNQVIILFNSIEYPTQLRTSEREVAHYVYKHPHPLVEKHWNEKHKRIRTYIDAQLDRLKQESPDHLNEIHRNLFIDERLATIVKANLEEVSEVLEQLGLKLEKVKDSYENLPGTAQ